MVKTALLAAAMTVAGAGGALAWNDIYQGDGTTKAGDILIHPYRAANRCPAGRQPVIVGGVICCGVPNTQAHYVNRPGARRHYGGGGGSKSPAMYAPEGAKGVTYN